MKLGKGRRRKELKAQPAKKEHIFVGVPCGGDDIHLGVQQFLAMCDRISVKPDEKFRFSWRIEVGKRPVEYARNVIVGHFLRSDCTRLWMIDADMIPTPATWQLLHVDADLVGPRMFAIKRNPGDNKPRLELCAYKYNVKGDHRFNSIIPMNGTTVIDCDAIGTGCILIRRKVLEDKRMWFDGEWTWQDRKGDCATETTPEYAPPLFRMHYKPNGEILRGEDLDFSLRAGGLGYSIKAHVGIPVGHCKTTNLEDLALMTHQALQNYIESQDANQDQVDGGRPAPSGEGLRGNGGGPPRAVLEGARAVRDSQPGATPGG